MKLQIILTCTFLATMFIGCSLADNSTEALADNSTEPLADDSTEALADNSTEEGRTETLETNSTSTSISEQNRIIVLVEKNDNLKVEKDSNIDYAARDLKWLVVRKVTNISRVEEISADDETGKTKRVLVEDRAEEFRVFRDDRYRQILDERDVKSIPFPLRFL